MGEDKLADITVNLFLYGELVCYGNKTNDYGYVNQQVSLSEASKVRDLLAYLGIPADNRGITFINGKLSAMPGVSPDLDVVLSDNDRVSFFDKKAMWPFQYRHGATVTEEMSQALLNENDRGLHHTYDGTQSSNG